MQAAAPQQSQPGARPPAQGLEAHYERFANLQQTNLQQQNSGRNTPANPQASFQQRQQQQQQQQQQRPPQNGGNNAMSAIQQMLLQTLNQETQRAPGWRAQVLVQERMALIFNVLGSLRLASQSQPNPRNLHKLVDFAIRFEREIFEKCNDKGAYRTKVDEKLAQLMERRNQNQDRLRQSIQQRAQQQAEPQAQQTPHNMASQQQSGTQPIQQGAVLTHELLNKRMQSATIQKKTATRAQTTAKSDRAILQKHQAQGMDVAFLHYRNPLSKVQPVKQRLDLFMKTTISQDMTASEGRRQKSRLCAIQSRPLCFSRKGTRSKAPQMSLLEEPTRVDN